MARLALRAMSEGVLFSQGTLYVVPYLPLVLLQDCHDVFQHRLALFDNLRLLQLSTCDHVHVGLQVGSHLHARYVVRVPLKCSDYGGAALRRFQDPRSLDKTAVVQLLDRLVSRALRAQPEVLHLLDERALRISLGRGGLLLGRMDPEHIDRVAYAELRELDLRVSIIWIVLAPSGECDQVSLAQERLSPNVKLDLGDQSPAQRCHGGEEPPRDQLVHVPVVSFELSLLRRLHRVYRRVVGRALLPSGRSQGLLFQELLCLFRELGLPQFLQYIPKAQRWRIDSVVRSGVRNVSICVEGLCYLHRLGRREADLVRLHQEGGRAEGYRRPLLVLRLLEILHHGGLRDLRLCDRGVSLVLVGELAVLVRRLELRLLPQIRVDEPIGRRVERCYLPFSVHDERKGRALDSPD